MAFAPEDIFRFNQFLDHALANPHGKEVIRVKLGVDKPPEPEVNNKTFEDKAYRRVDKYNA